MNFSKEKPLSFFFNEQLSKLKPHATKFQRTFHKFTLKVEGAFPAHTHS